MAAINENIDDLQPLREPDNDLTLAQDDLMGWANDNNTPRPERDMDSLDEEINVGGGKLNCFNYLADIPGDKADYDIVEVQFKNTRKGYFRNTDNLQLATGQLVAVESNPGHDIGRVTMTGRLVKKQMAKVGLRDDQDIKRVFRHATDADMEKYRQAKAREIDTMIRSRKIAKDLGLKMKIGDVEYQGDGNKAIFYYIADERVDFRQLIKVLAEQFKIRVEMRQIGARQEAGRIGGIGPCGRPLCCSSWMTSFVTVATSAARYQDLSLNPQKLAGQCAKLKCCLNFEIDTYMESVRKMPPKEARLETLDSTWYHFKTDVFKGEITYSTDKHNAVNLTTITAERAFEIIAINKAGEKPLSLLSDAQLNAEKPKGEYADLLSDDSDLGRFDRKKKKKKKKGGGGAAAQPAQNADKGADTPAKSSDAQPQKGGGQQPQQKGTNQQPQQKAGKPKNKKKKNHGNGNGGGTQPPATPSNADSQQ